MRTHQETPAIEVSGLRQRYGDFEAVRGVSFSVATGELFALLGTNGAGKTTTIEVLEGYRPATEGRVRVLGLDPHRDRRALRPRMGIMLQHGGFLEDLTVAETAAAWAGFAADVNRPAIGDVLELVGLAQRRAPGYGSCPAGRSAGSTSRSPWSPAPTCSSSTSPPPAWTRRRAATPGR
jgi:ABC-2 type transport system ATP-binding protein